MNPYQPGEDNQDPYEVGFKAGAASRDAYIEQLELALLQVRKAICGDIHNTDDLLDLIASRDAEAANPTAVLTLLAENQSLRQQLEASQKREVILRDELFAVLVQDMSRDSAIAKIEALAATESKA